MVRKQRKRISYVLPLAKSSGGHRLGVNGLAVDPYNSILYSGGRDGVICAWDLNLDLTPYTEHSLSSALNSSGDLSPKGTPSTSFRQQVQAHTHWINDIVLAQNNEALVSASSDITVKLWRPAASDGAPPQTIGLHSDYVKCLASPGPFGNFVASGGLDRKIYLWDLNGGGQNLQINVGEEENTAKGSVYALAVTSTLLASGGPESIVRIWDPRSGKRITKLVGHTDNIRDVLISQDGDTVMTASSDQTVKVWSMTAGRCMYTLTMHNDSVWSLYSDHPRLSIFYSSDRSGVVAKTDTRGCAEIDEGLSVAVCQEHEGVAKVVHAGDYLWTATASSSINRWKDVETDADVQMPESYSWHRASIATTTRSKIPSPPSSLTPVTSREENPNKLPAKSLLRISNSAPFPVYRSREADTPILTSTRKASEAVVLEVEGSLVVPFRSVPDHTIEGQHGLIKHVTLNDRRRVLTVDTAGDVTMWDLLRCAPIQSFGKRHLDDVLKEVNTSETVAHWCAVDTRTGSLTCVLEENNCFDAEMYADEVQIEEKIEFREDQRINLGKWLLRYLFSNLIDEEIRRDEAYRKQLVESKRQSLDRSQAPSSIQIPDSSLASWKDASSGPTSASTLKPTNGYHAPLPTPGLAIGLATPSAYPPSHTSNHTSTLPSTAEEGHELERTSTQNRESSDRHSHDYFSQPHSGPTSTPGASTNGQIASPGGETQTQPPAEVPQSPALEGQDQEKSEKKLFGGKKFRMNFGMKSLKKTQTAESQVTKVVETPSEDSDSRSSKTEEKLIEDNFFGAIQRIRLGYEDQLHHILHDKERKEHSPSRIKLASAITPSLPVETPVLKPPLNTTVLIQEDRVDSGGVADLFEGTVSNLGTKADLIEKVAPMWLADVLLRNHIPPKEIVKVSFILEPWQGLLPSIASDGDTNTRLNANRMLRARKILAYIAERIEPAPEKPDPHALKPEEYLELYCQNQLIPPTMTLATIRAHVWRGGGDVLLYYKANGRKPILHSPQATAGATPPAEPAGSTNPSPEHEDAHGSPATATTHGGHSPAHSRPHTSSGSAGHSPAHLRGDFHSSHSASHNRSHSHGHQSRPSMGSHRSRSSQDARTSAEGRAGQGGGR